MVLLTGIALVITLFGGVIGLDYLFRHIATAKTESNAKKFNDRQLRKFNEKLGLIPEQVEDPLKWVLDNTELPDDVREELEDIALARSI